MEKYHVYWLHEPGHTDILTEGYVGITMDIDRRLSQHKNKNLLHTIITVGTKQHCKEIEHKLRPESHIGLNINPGGGLPSDRNREINRERLLTNNPMKTLRHNSGTFKKGHNNGKAFIWDKNRREKASIAKRGSNNPNFGKKETAKRLNKRAACPVCGTVTNLGNLKRWHKHELA